MTLEALLPTVEPRRWKVRQVIIFDWFDGPREGVVWLDFPNCEFFFRLRSERHTADDLDDRLLLLSEIPGGSVAKILTVIEVLGEPTDPVWVPVWQFPTELERKSTDQEIDRVLARKKETWVVIRTRDMLEFLGCWLVDRDSIEQADLFETLKIA